MAASQDAGNDVNQDEESASRILELLRSPGGALVVRHCMYQKFGVSGTFQIS